jgi:hypothetical protein
MPKNVKAIVIECSPYHHAINSRNDGVNNAPIKVIHSLMYIIFFISSFPLLDYFSLLW